MERDDAIRRLRELDGHELRPLADAYGVTVWCGARINKGWAGHVLERHLGMPINSSQHPDFGSWELKLVPLKRLPSGAIRVKETMAITMIDPIHVLETSFERSHLFAKLRRVVVCARLFESQTEVCSRLERVTTFDMSDPKTIDQVREDYELVRETIRHLGFGALSGRMGVLVQPRTKGPGHGSTSRAFYARVDFVQHMLGL